TFEMKQFVENRRQAGPGWRERGWLTAGGEPPAFSLRLALSWFSGTYRSSGENPVVQGGVAGRKGRLTQPSKPPSRRTIQSKHAWFPPPRRFHPPLSLYRQHAVHPLVPLEEGER
ncbi:hypothetical protein ALC57_17347, partial [Trachymyrmex cornetzi]